MKTYLVALCRQLNSLAYGEATGARPKTGNQTDKHGHYTKETDDRKFKLELKKRNKRKAEIERWKQRALEIEKHYQEWEVKHLQEINEIVEAVMIMTTADALLFKLSVMELTLIHITGTEMPADTLSRQAHRETKGLIPVAASSIMEAFPEAMSNLHWKYEQSEDAQCKVMKA